LGDIGPEAKSAIPALLEFLQGPDDDAVEGATAALPKIGPAAIPALAELLRDKKAGARLVAAQALLRLGDQPRKTAIPVLIELLRDKEATIRIRAAWTLDDIRPEATAAIPALIQLLQDQDEEAQMAAVWTLRGMGPAAREAIPALTEFHRNGPTVLRGDAAEALEEIKKQPPAGAVKKP
jgi:HEAT repeat protein